MSFFFVLFFLDFRVPYFHLNSVRLIGIMDWVVALLRILLAAPSYSHFEFHLHV